MRRQRTIRPRRGRPQIDEAKAFRTLLAVLRYKRAIRKQGPSQKYYSSATISRTAWEWAEDGKLRCLWQEYLEGLPADEVRMWAKLFTYYRDSWKNRKLARRWAGRVHSKWFWVMDKVGRRICGE